MVFCSYLFRIWLVRRFALRPNMTCVCVFVYVFNVSIRKHVICSQDNFGNDGLRVKRIGAAHSTHEKKPQHQTGMHVRMHLIKCVTIGDYFGILMSAHTSRGTSSSHSMLMTYCLVLFLCMFRRQHDKGALTKSVTKENKLLSIIQL